MPVFTPHYCGSYDPTLHSFPGMSADAAIDVTKYDKVVVNEQEFDVEKYMWVYSYYGNRYLGGFLPYFISNKNLMLGDTIYDKERNVISCITKSCGDKYCISGIGYETFDVSDATSVSVHHNVLLDGHSVYGSIQGKYSDIKEYAQSKSKLATKIITDYYVWVGNSITQITSTDIDGKEITRIRYKHGGILASPF